MTNLTKKPETKLWNRLRTVVPSDVLASRVETVSDDGFPDVLFGWPSGVCSFVELKVAEFIHEKTEIMASRLVPVIIADFRRVETARSPELSFDQIIGLEAPPNKVERRRIVRRKTALEILSGLLRPDQVAWHVRAASRGARSWVLVSPAPGRVAVIPFPTTSATGPMGPAPSSLLPGPAPSGPAPSPDLPGPAPYGLPCVVTASLALALDHIRRSDEHKALRRLSEGHE
jgi:hypothetical protein